MATPLKQRLDYDDYAAIPPDRNTYQIIDGELYVTPAPTPLHQRASKRLQRQLESYFEEQEIGEVFDAPIDLILSHHDVVQPDLVVVTDPALVTERAIEGGPPTLVVEVLSPSTRGLDRSTKAQRYADFDVPHYWIVDPEDRTIACHRVEDGEYRAVREMGADESFDHPDWPGLQISAADIWR